MPSAGAGRLNEFDLIARYFTGKSPTRADVVLGIGDDGALVSVPAGMELVLTMDTLVAGVHFPAHTAAAAIGHKALAVNLSDLAAMGATPAWATLALTLPQANSGWLADFAAGFYALAHSHGVALIGGDTTRGPLTITVQAHGFVPAGSALRRNGARAGDEIYVTGTLGDAGLGLRVALGEVSLAPADAQCVRARLECPTPRVAAGLVLRGRATAAIDVSDGLMADLGHVLTASGCGAVVEAACLPLSPALSGWATANERWQLALTAGDDYELCFTVAPQQAQQVQMDLAAVGVPATRIGQVTAQTQLHCLQPDGTPVALSQAGYQHFSSRV